MLRFNVRDLLWLTLVVAMGLAWFVREGQLQAQADRKSKQATEWQQAAMALEYILGQDGWEVSLSFESSEAWVWRKKTDDGYKNERRHRVPLYLFPVPADE